MRCRRMALDIVLPRIRNQGLRGRFGNYVPPVLKHLGLAEVEDKPRGNRMRAIEQ